VQHEAVPLRPSDLKLDGHLLFAHGTQARVTDRSVPPSHYASVAQNAMTATALAGALSGTSVAAHAAHAGAAPSHAGRAHSRAGHGSGGDDEAPSASANRTALMQTKARMRAAGVDWHDPQPVAARVPSVPMTVAPRATAPLVGPAAPKAPYQAMTDVALSGTVTLTATAAAPAQAGHGRSFAFTKQFHRGVGGRE
jgi:hypothetical protein